MTGHNHLRQQRERCGRFAGYCLLVLIPSWLAMLALDNSWLTRSVIALSFVPIAAIVTLFPPRCPSCRKLQPSNVP